MKKFLIFLTIGIVGFTSCKKEEFKQEDATLEIIGTEIVFDSKGGNASFEVKSNSNWTVSCDADWLTISPTEGMGNAEVNLSASASDVYDDRNTVITVKAGDKTETFTVTQKYAEALLVTKNKFDIPQEGGDFTIEIQSNISYEIQIASDSQSWISEAPQSKALTTYTHTFSVESNPNTTKRDGSIEIIGSNGKTETVNIYQAKKDELVLSKSEEIVSAKGGEVRVQLRSNVDYEVIMPENTDWIEQIQSDKADELIFNVKPNSETMTRDAQITIKDKNSDLSQIFTIVQVVGSIILEETYFEVSASGDTLDVIFTPDVDYEIIMDETNSSWISYDIETSDDSYQHHLTVYIGPNTVNKTRTAKIDIKDKNSDIKGTVTIKQLTGDIILEKTRIDVNVAGETVTVPFATDIEYNVIVPDEYSAWISLVTSTQTKALRDTSFCLKIEPNATKNRREAKIEVKDKYSDLSQTLTITQDYMRIGIDGKSYTVPARGQELTVRTTYANIEYKINIPEEVSSWISVLENNDGTDADSFTLKVEPNNDLKVRNATISISDEKNLISEKITIQQDIAEMSLINRDSSELNWFNTNLVISVASNVETELIIPEDAQTWIQNITEKVAPDSDIKTFRLNILANESDVDNRETELIFKDKYSPMQLKYHILQYNNSEYHGDVLLDSEDDLSAYSRYERIYGDVSIGGGFQTLQTLNNKLKEIYGDASITAMSLDGLYGLKNVYGNLTVHSEGSEGLNNLETVQGSLAVGKYSSSINFEQLKIIGGDCDATNCKFERLQRIGGNILYNCPNYLPNLEYVGGDVTCAFAYNDENKEYNLKSLISVGGNLSVGGTLPDIYTTGAKSLSFLPSLETIIGDCYINSKSTLGANKLKSIGGNFNIETDSFEGLTNLEYIGGNFTQHTYTGIVSFIGLSNLKSIGGSLIIDITTNDRFTSFEGLNNLEQVGGFAFSVSSGGAIVNNNMESFAGLDNLKRVLGDFAISGCSFGFEKLTSLNGLNLEKITGNLIIEDIVNLSDISSLAKLSSVNNITITGCKSLFDFTPLIGLVKTMTGAWFVSGCGYNPTKYQMLNGESKPQE